MSNKKNDKPNKSKTDFEIMYKTIFVFFVCSLLVSIIIFSMLYFCSNPENPKNGFTAKDYLNMAQTIAIALAVLTGTITAGMAYRSHQIKEVDSTNKRFNEAVNALVDENKYISMQGVRALERLARNAPNKHERQAVVRMLCDYLRDNRDGNLRKPLKALERHGTK